MQKHYIYFPNEHHPLNMVLVCEENEGFEYDNSHVYTQKPIEVSKQRNSGSLNRQT